MTEKQLSELKAAARELSDLNTFAIVVSVLEGGHIHAPHYEAADRIIKLCKAEQDKCLRGYDRALHASVAASSSPRSSRGKRR